jgi:hypothetical protein
MGLRPHSKGKLCDSTSNFITDSGQLADTVSFELLGSGLGRDVESTLQSALSGGAIFANQHDAPGIFRQALASSIRSIDSHPRGRLFQEFLLKGPYEDVGDIPKSLAGQRLSDAESAAAITFIYSHMVNCFKGAVAELLASKACLHLMKRLQEDSELPGNARLYVGDSVGIRGVKGKGLFKGADLHIMIEERNPDTASIITVAGLVEVKSYILSQSRLCKQLDRHLALLCHSAQPYHAGVSITQLEGKIVVGDKTIDLRIEIDKSGKARVNRKPKTQLKDTEDSMDKMEMELITHFISTVSGQNPNPILSENFLYFHSYRKVQEGNPDLGMMVEDDNVRRRIRPPGYDVPISTFKLQILRSMMSRNYI